MPRSNRPRRAPSAGGRRPGRGGQGRGGPGKYGEAPELDLERARAGIPTRESAPDGEWAVRRITARNAAKEYLCPGCSRAILPGIEHLVVWQEDSLFGAETAVADRRHWHTHCWRTRTYRYRG
jgi:hypothetical protein